MKLQPHPLTELSDLNWQAIRGALPTTKDEYYRPTQLGSLNSVITKKIDANTQLLNLWASGQTYVLTFMGGEFKPGHSTLNALPKGVEFSWQNSSAQGAGPQNNQSAFQRWSRKWPGHYRLEIAEGIELNSPLWIVNLSSEGEPGLSGLNLQIEAHAHTRFSLVCTLANHLGHHHSFQSTALRLAKSAKVNVISIGDLGAESWGLDRFEVSCCENAQIEHHSYSFGGQLFRQELEINLEGEQAHASSFGLMLGQGRSHSDHATRIAHHVGKTTSEQFYKSMLDESARAIFKGNIFVHPQAQQVQSSQLNKTVLLSNTAEIMSRPQLEIYADDVKCSHGATVGELDDQELFYLQTRGITPERARILLASACAQEIVAKIKDAQLSSFVQNLVSGELKKMKSLNLGSLS